MPIDRLASDFLNPLRSHFARYLRGAERSETKEISLKRMRIRNDQKNDRNTIH